MYRTVQRYNMKEAVQPSTPYVKGKKLIITTLIIYALLMATHLGEFWPFSVYPMFSVAGKPWMRQISREIPVLPEENLWTEVVVKELPGKPFVVSQYGLNQADLSSFVKKTKVWDQEHVTELKAKFAQVLDTTNIVVYNAKGIFDKSQGEVNITLKPVFYFSKDQSLMNPELKEGAVK